jgi:hypothetical protein
MNRWASRSWGEPSQAAQPPRYHASRRTPSVSVGFLLATLAQVSRPRAGTRCSRGNPVCSAPVPRGACDERIGAGSVGAVAANAALAPWRLCRDEAGAGGAVGAVGRGASRQLGGGERDASRLGGHPGGRDLAAPVSSHREEHAPHTRRGRGHGGLARGLSASAEVDVASSSIARSGAPTSGRIRANRSRTVGRGGRSARTPPRDASARRVDEPRAARSGERRGAPTQRPAAGGPPPASLPDTLVENRKRYRNGEG